MGGGNEYIKWISFGDFRMCLLTSIGVGSKRRRGRLARSILIGEGIIERGIRTGHFLFSAKHVL